MSLSLASLHGDIGIVPSWICRCRSFSTAACHSGERTFPDSRHKSSQIFSSSSTFCATVRPSSFKSIDMRTSLLCILAAMKSLVTNSCSRVKKRSDSIGCAGLIGSLRTKFCLACRVRRLWYELAVFDLPGPMLPGLPSGVKNRPRWTDADGKQRTVGA